MWALPWRPVLGDVAVDGGGDADDAVDDALPPLLLGDSVELGCWSDSVSIVSIGSEPQSNDGASGDNSPLLSKNRHTFP